MNHIDDIFKRCNIQQICQFILYGTECVSIDSPSYKERISNANNALLSFLKPKYPNEREFEEIIEHIYNYSGVIEEVYMEIDLKTGTALIIQAINC